MKFLFLSNFFNHHQAPFSDALYEQLGDGYRFVETITMFQERKDMGWEFDDYPSYVLVPADSSEEKSRQADMIDQADAVLMGSAPDEMLRGRHRKKKLTIRYSERFFKKPCPAWQIPLRYVRNYLRLGRHKNEYMLCASAFTAADLAMTRTFLGKTYKWGYFPETRHYDLEALFAKKRENQRPVLLWVGRMIDCKHPEAAIHTAKALKSQGYDFELHMIGKGNMRETLEQLIHTYQLEDCVSLLGAMTPGQVRDHMEQADIFLFTSDRGEGWGAVLNESMNSGCAVVASHAIGSVPYLMKHGENGLIYPDGSQEALLSSVIRLLEDRALREQLGAEAYRTITQLWCAELAAERLIRFVEELQKHGCCDLYEEGPCSRAELIGDDWFILPADSQDEEAE